MSANETFEFDLEHNGKFYSVIAEVELSFEDDSFDHEFGTEEVHSVGVDDWSATVEDITDGDNTFEVDPDKVEGLNSAIRHKIDNEVCDLDPNDYFDSDGRPDDGDYDESWRD